MSLRSTSPPGADPPAARWRILYRLYEHLRDHDLTRESGTSRLLRAPDPALLRARLADELDELAGVAVGSHRHHGWPEDVTLEGSQVCYWTLVWAIGAGQRFEDLRPGGWLRDAPAVAPNEAATQGRALAEAIRDGTAQPPAVWGAALRQVALVCAACGVSPAAVVEFDLAQMAARPYLAPVHENLIEQEN
jgi:hypothetical protein